MDGDEVKKKDLLEAISIKTEEDGAISNLSLDSINIEVLYELFKEQIKKDLLFNKEKVWQL